MSSRQPGQPQHVIDKSLLDACIHCGLCLPACPTYLATGREVESPRGRIHLLNSWQQGQQELSPRLVEHIESCLGCLGCQSACPSGVRYEEILNQAKPQLAKVRSGFTRSVQRLAFQKILPNYRLLIQLAKLLRFWQKSNGSALLEKIAQIIPISFIRYLQTLASYLPTIPKHIPLAAKSWNMGSKEGTVQLFAGCVMDIFYGPANHAAVRLLCSQRQVVEVGDQTCCGALAFHAGEVDITKELAKKNIDFFEQADGPIVVTSAGCGAMLKEYTTLFEKDSPWYKRAQQFCHRIQDISEFLSSHQFPESVRNRAQATVATVTYHAACHLAHAQNVRLAPQTLLTNLEGDINAQAKANLTDTLSTLKLIPLQDAEHCCGSAGIFNILHPELSNEILEAKIDRLKESNAQLVVTSNPGCLLQLEAGIRRRKLPMRTAHLVELLDESYQLSLGNQVI